MFVFDQEKNLKQISLLFECKAPPSGSSGLLQQHKCLPHTVDVFFYSQTFFFYEQHKKVKSYPLEVSINVSVWLLQSQAELKTHLNDIQYVLFRLLRSFVKTELKNSFLSISLFRSS